MRERGVALLVLGLLAACGDPGRRYELEVVPTELALARADGLAVALVRPDTGARRDFRFDLPTPLAAPWHLSITTGAWQDAQLLVEVSALEGEAPIAIGRSSATSALIQVTLEDVPSSADGGLPADLGDAAAATPPVARLLAPSSGSIVQRAHPTLRFELLRAFASARLELCADRGCASVLEVIDVAPGARSGVPTVALPRGPVFWRVVDRGGNGSAVWSFFVPAVASDAKPDSTQGLVLDVNGDGYADLAVAAPNESVANQSEGRIYVYLGGADGIVETRLQTLDGSFGSAVSFGRPLAAAGDVNGDGFGDLLTGVPGVGSGRALIYLGGEAGVDPARAWTLPSNDGASSDFALAIAAGGDLDEDGYADVLVGARSYSPTGNGGGPGRAHVFHGGANGPRLPPLDIQGTLVAGAGFGATIAAGADFDGDGHLDVAIGAPAKDLITPSVYLYLGGPGGLTPLDAGRTRTATWSNNSQFAVALALGDVDADGRADLIAGAPATPLPGGARGTLLVYQGTTAAGLGAPLIVDCPAPGDPSFGGTLAFVGDLNGDGAGDLASRTLPGGQPALRIYLGGSPLLAPGDATRTFLLALPGLNHVLVGGRDLDRDGLDDLVVGSSGQQAAGRVDLYRGNALGPPTLLTTLTGGAMVASNFGKALGRRGHAKARR